MKKLTLLAVATTMMLSSCMDKAEIQRLERKRFVQDSVQHRIDSLKTTDMHLSFMGIVIGESADSVTKAIEDGMIPPTINLDEPDEGLDLDYTPKTAKKREINVAASTNLGFGGHDACVVFKKL